jgi:cysteine synthase A
MKKNYIGCNILEFMGGTPIVKLHKSLPSNIGNVYVKLEEFNPGGSIKSRIAYQMVKQAEERGILFPNSGQTIIEPTGGNTGIGLALVGAIRGYKIVLVIPDNFSKEKIKTLKAYGAKVILSDSRGGNNSHIKLVEEIVKSNPDYVYLNQFTNPANPMVHYEKTAIEIIESIEKVDCFVAGIGSGGTITGVGRRIKEHFPKSLIVGVQPKGCDVLKGKAIPHKIIALALGMLPEVLDVNIVDRMISVTYEESKRYMIKLAKNEGLLVGISSGANICGAIEMAKELGEESNIITVAPDSGRSYMEVFDEN